MPSVVARTGDDVGPSATPSTPESAATVTEYSVPGNRPSTSFEELELSVYVRLK